MPTTIDGTGRPAYMYDETTSTWIEISGKVSTGANYQWTGVHQFDNNVVIKGALTAALNFNSFLNPAARTAAMSASGSLALGLLSFIRQDSVGNTVNKFQYWNGTIWVDLGNVVYQSIAPSSPTTGSMWVDSDNYLIYIYNGSAWVQIGGPAYQSTAPTGAVSGNIWINSVTKDMYVYDGSAWKQTGGAGGLNSFFLAGM
jgi:hypothetical protein